MQAICLDNFVIMRYRTKNGIEITLFRLLNTMVYFVIYFFFIIYRFLNMHNLCYIVLVNESQKFVFRIQQNVI